MMGFIKNVASMRAGAKKAKRDIALARERLARFPNPTQDRTPEGRAFWDALGSDVSRNDPIEWATYQRITQDFMRKWIRQNRPAPRIQSIQTAVVDLGGLDPEELPGAIMQAIMMALNRGAGRCQGCGGAIDAEGHCLGEHEVSETEEPVEYKIARLRARLDQIEAAIRDAVASGKGQEEPPAELVAELNEIGAELTSLLGNSNSNSNKSKDEGADQ